MSHTCPPADVTLETKMYFHHSPDKEPQCFRFSLFPPPHTHPNLPSLQAECCQRLVNDHSVKSRRRSETSGIFARNWIKMCHTLLWTCASTSPKCPGQDWQRRLCGILTTPLADRKLSIWRGWLGWGLDRASGLALQRVLEQRRECLRRDFRPPSGDRPRCLDAGQRDLRVFWWGAWQRGDWGTNGIWGQQSEFRCVCVNYVCIPPPAHPSVFTYSLICLSDKCVFTYLALLWGLGMQLWRQKGSRWSWFSLLSFVCLWLSLCLPVSVCTWLCVRLGVSICVFMCLSINVTAYICVSLCIWLHHLWNRGILLTVTQNFWKKNLMKTTKMPSASLSDVDLAACLWWNLKESLTP